MEPKFYQSPPRDFPDYPKLTYDEFLPYEGKVKVTKWRHGARTSVISTVLDAAQSMRLSTTKRGSKPYSYTINLANDNDLNEALRLPKEVEAIDLYSNFWPFKTVDNYLKLYSKLFHGYPKNYKSARSVKYAGKSEWLYLMTGSIKIDLIEPTAYNLAKFQLDSNDADFQPESGTNQEFVMTEGSFLIIPGGWISQRTAKQNSFMLGGEYLQYENFGHQLQCFDRDVINTNGANFLEADIDIRSLYWLTAAKILDHDKEILQRLHRSDVDTLKETLLDWKKKFKTNTIPPNLYAPMGMNLDLISRDLTNLWCVRKSRGSAGKFLKSKKDPDNVLMDQTSAYNQPN